MTFGERAIEFHSNLQFKGELPVGIHVMNPYQDNPNVLQVIHQFYHKFYDDHYVRRLILGINPGRFGAGVTGIPFTDTKRLQENCGIVLEGTKTHETSSVFVYQVIDAFGGTERFFKQFYIGAISPLGFTAMGKNGRQVNYNYYDSGELTRAVYDFTVKSISAQLSFGCARDVCFCLGTGKNEKFLTRINQEHHFFDRIVALEHPRFVMQYRAKYKEAYVKKYVECLHFKC